MFAASKTASVSGGYQISRSLRFNSADSAYLGRTPTTASNRKTWTWSGWVKRTKLGVRQGLFSCQAGTGLQFGFLDNDVFQMGTNAVYVLQSTQVFRDPSAWYHIVVTVNTTLASNRCSVYINGTQITAWGLNTFDSTFAQNSDTAINLNGDHALGQIGTSISFFSGYMTEVNFIDGQGLTPSSFGETNAQTGVWQPKAFSGGAYGTHGFYVNFSDNSNTTAATLGKDYSGNGNNWIPFNFSVTAGAGNDSLVDSPTSYGTDTGVGGTVRGNYATMNPLSQYGCTFANGNLDTILTTTASPQSESGVSNFGVSSGKWYCEIVSTGGSGPFIGIADASLQAAGRTFNSSSVWSYYVSGSKYNGGTATAYGASWTTNDVIGIALDMDAGTVTFYKNGASQGVAFSGLTGRSIVAWVSTGTGSVGAVITFVSNFGQRPFAYTAPSGFKALCTQNLPTPTIGATTATQAGKYFNPVLYTGNGGTQSVTGVGFQPDWTWLKSRSGVIGHVLVDAVRGVDKLLQSESTGAESTYGGVTAFNADGISVSTQSGTLSGTNKLSETYVAWNWKANGSGSTNTAGSITSTVSANTTSGFSVVRWTGSSTNSTVGHGLGVAPKFIITKPATEAIDWFCYHESLGRSAYILLNSTNAAGAYTDYWGSTAFTSSVFGVFPGGGGGNNRVGQTMIAYCFAEVAGYSKFGSYTGNGSADGPFIYTGFRPAYVMIKATSAIATPWVVKDKLRAANYNPQDGNLYPNLSNAEDTTASVYIDLLSNGFKIRGTYAGINNSGSDFIFMAFAESPFKTSLAR